jgi:uncharacterized protein YdeI (YjbR/CyaY-like superfamily)
MTWPESVDEALCFGWIDGIRRRLDDQSYTIRFTPRRPGSTWSRINIAKAEQQIAAGRMRPAGLEAFQRRLEHKSGIYSFEQNGVLELPAADLKEVRKNRAAWVYYQKLPPSCRKAYLHWILSAKQPQTRARRLSKMIEACAAGRRPMA